MRPRTSTVFLTCVVLYLCSYVTGERCSRNVITKIASFEPGTIYSPGYPQNYEANEDCTWTISAAIQDGSYAIQVVSTEMDINDNENDCNSDYIEIYDGDSSNPGSLLDRWCGSEKKVLKRLGTKITIKFHSNGHYSGKGFVLSYSLIKHSSTQCEEGQTGMIEVGNYPQYELFNGRKSVTRCEWKIEASDPDSRLVLELFKPSSISCHEAKFEFYDGGDTNGHVSFEYCSTLKPFSTMYLSSHVTSLVLTTELDAMMDDMILKISTRSTSYECTTNSFPNIEVEGAPVIFAMPFAKDNRNTPCPVRIWAKESEKMLRLDVMGTDAGEVTCSTDVIEVKEAGSNNPIMKTCNRGRNPVYRGVESDTFIVTTKTQSNVFLRTSAVYWKCNGNTIEERAYSSLILEEVLPQEGGYSDLSQCRYLITANEDKALVRLSLHWQLPIKERDYSRTNTNSCEGDYITIYDGDSETDPVLTSTCHNNNSPSMLDETVVSSQRQLLLVMDTDARIEGQAATLKFHSIPGGEHCMEKDKKMITVNRNSQTLTSPNYPNSFPMYQACIYHLMSENPDEDIVVEVVEANLDKQCRNVLTVYDGDYGDDSGTIHTKDNYKVTKTPEVVGRVCGKDTPTYRIASQAVSLFALSEEVDGPGGWKVAVYTVKAGGGNMGDTIKLSLWLACLMLALGLLFMSP